MKINKIEKTKLDGKGLLMLILRNQETWLRSLWERLMV